MNTLSGIAANRHRRILSTLKETDTVRVDELSRLLDVSAVTVRRDLDTLDARGLLIRTHGGARKLHTPIASEPERSFFEKGIVNTEEKKRIAVLAAGLIGEDEILFLNSGTTALFFLEALQHRVRVVTNNATSIVCRRDASVGLLVLGGEYREQSRSFVGDFALNAIRGVHSSTTVLGTNGLSLEKGLTTSVLAECGVNQSMIENTQGKVIVLADFSKIEHVSNFVSAPLDDIDVVVTDDKTPRPVIEELRSHEIEVLIA